MLVKELEHPDWVRRLNLFGDAVGDPRTVVGLDADELLALARATTGLDDLGEARLAGLDRDVRAAARVDRRRVAAAPARPRADPRARCCACSRPGCGCRTRGRRRRRSPRSRSTRRCSSSDRRAPARRSCSSCSRSTRSCAHRSRGRRCTRCASMGSRRARALALSECEQEFWADIHPEFMTMHELASDLPCECVHFLDVRLRGPVLVDALRHAELHRLAARAPRDRSAACTGCTAACCRRSSTGARPVTAPVAAEVAGPRVDAARSCSPSIPTRKVIHTHRDPRKFIASLVSILLGVCGSCAATRSTSRRSRR